MSIIFFSINLIDILYYSCSHPFNFSKHGCEDNKNEFKYEYVGHRYRIDV